MLASGAILTKHRKLDRRLETLQNGDPFISDWNCYHPFYQDVFHSVEPKKFEVQKYNYFRSEKGLNRLISQFHTGKENAGYSEDEIIVSNGSATIISAFLVWLKMEKVEYIYYIPPLYYTFHFFSRIYNIALRPISKHHLFDTHAVLNLPMKRSILVFTDPIWYAGCSVSGKTIARLIEWQHSTKSLVFIDGSFQYFKWDLSKHEESAQFSKHRTFRLVCPSKAVATHGLRFAYLLLPSRFNGAFDLILDSLLGSSNPYDIRFAKKCMKLLLSKPSNNELIGYTKAIYDDLSKRGYISTSVEPDCGYFIFAHWNKRNRTEVVSMDGSYFEQTRFRNFVRINLLSPYIRKIVAPMFLPAAAYP